VSSSSECFCLFVQHLNDFCRTTFSIFSLALAFDFADLLGSFCAWVMMLNGLDMEILSFINSLWSFHKLSSSQKIQWVIKSPSWWFINAAHSCTTRYGSSHFPHLFAILCSHISNLSFNICILNGQRSERTNKEKVLV
jgi:hypothetical protein